MSKILFLVNHDVVIYNFRLELVEALLSQGHEVVISSPYGERIEDLKKLSCKYIEAHMERHGMNPIKELKLFAYYKRLIKQEKPDYIFGYTIKPNIYGALAAQCTKTPFIANITGLGTAVENPGLTQVITIALYKVAFRRIQRVFFQNTENQEFFIKHKIAVDKHGLLPGSGVNLKRFHLLEYPSNDTIRFAFISRIMKEKGIDQYLEAAQAVKAMYPNTEFHICGFCEEAYEDTLKQLHEDSVIVYHGMVRNVAEFMKNIHCVVHPTYYPEGISNVLLEASACGRPIITTDRAGCREVINAGINGFVIEQKNTEMLIEKIIEFIELPYEEKVNMGRAGRIKVEKEFDRQIVVAAYLKEICN